MLDPGARIFEIKRIVAVGTFRITDCDANLADPPQPLGDDMQIVSLGRDENPVGILEPALLHTIHPDNEGASARFEGGTGFRRGAYEVGDGEATCLDDLIAQPTHAARLLDAIGGRKSQILVDLATDVVRIEVDGVQSRRAPSQAWSCRLPAIP